MPEDSKPSRSTPPLTDLHPEFLKAVAVSLARKFPPPDLADPLSVVDERGRAEHIRRAAHQEVIKALVDATKIQAQKQKAGGST